MNMIYHSNHSIMKNNLFNNKYRIPSARLQNWDYRSNASYYITITTAKMHHYFGEIIDDKMQFSPIGILADVFLYDINNYTKNAELDIYVVMPNHIHLILTLKNEDYDNVDNMNADLDANADNMNSNYCTDVAHISDKNANADNMESNYRTDVARNVSIQMASISPKSGSISAIIRNYKSAITKHANRLNLDFKWHTRFHDHIIRNTNDYKRIYKYITDNPKKWNNDKRNKF